MLKYIDMKHLLSKNSIYNFERDSYLPAPELLVQERPNQFWQSFTVKQLALYVFLGIHSPLVGLPPTVSK
jgi:hypothetical protein